jgi:hypothetical protein
MGVSSIYSHRIPLEKDKKGFIFPCVKSQGLSSVLNHINNDLKGIAELWQAFNFV